MSPITTPPTQTSDHPIKDFHVDLPQASRRSDAIERVAKGDRGRIWMLPIRVTVTAADETSREHYSISAHECSVVKALDKFLLTNTPTLHRSWYNSMSETGKGLLDMANRGFYSYDLIHLDAFDKLEISSTNPKIPNFKVPTIDEDHWAYKRHFNVGNGISYRVSDEQALEMSHREASSDVGSIIRYIKAYRDFIQQPSGEHLFNATSNGSFRDPYMTCMEICISELGLPGHLLTLIHYGIALHKSYGNSHSMWRQAPNQVQQLFNSLVHLYLEDFGKCFPSAITPLKD